MGRLSTYAQAVCAMCSLVLTLNTRQKHLEDELHAQIKIRVNDLLPDHVSPEFVISRLLSEKDELTRKVERSDMK